MTRIVKAHDDQYNRKVVEQHACDILVFPAKGKRKDTLRNLDSGVNHVLAKLAAKKSIAFALDLAILRTLNKKEKAQEIARWKHIIQQTKKAKTPLAILGSKDSKECQALLLSLQASTQQAAEAISF